MIQIVGSRGDVQPFVALGQVLRDTYGHRVRIATHATFKSFVEENGLEFFSIGGDPAELMAFMVKNPGLMPGMDALKSGEIRKRRQGIEQILLGCWRSCIEAGDGLGPAPQTHRTSERVNYNNQTLPGNPSARPFVADVIIANPPSFAHIHIAEKLGIPLHMMFTMPWTATRAFPHPLANIQSSNTDVVMTNYVSYALVEMMTWQGLGDVINRFRDKVLDLEPLSLIWAPGLLTRLRIPTTYCWSPALIPKPNDWGSEISVAGFYFLDLARDYVPDQELARFLSQGPPPVYIGFGSIVVDDPNKLTRTIFDAVTRAGCRALVSKGWGGLGVDSVGIPEGVFMLGNCPHDWLFERVSAVVHHGGAGTSAAGIKAGKPTVVVPFFGDQPFWGAMINRAGAGPKPTPYQALNADNLAASIVEALKPETKARAEELGRSIGQEKGADEGGKDFHQFLNMDEMRCSVAPSRVAVWRVRRTKTRLSSLAAAVLEREGLISYADLKLYRSKDHDTQDQPWDPISAVTSALVGDIGSIAMAVGDFPRELFTGAKKGKAKAASNAGTPTEELKETLSTAGASSTSNLMELESETSGPASSLTATKTDTSSSSGAGPATGVTSPQPTASGTLSPPSQSRRPSTSLSDSGSAQISLETAIGAGKGVGRIVETGMKTPMNFCMGLARGFRNAPRLYNDDTVRPQEKVTDFTSGLKVAGKEFGLGLYDGISGLVTQPIKGAQKEGGAGLFKGFAKGVGGLVLKSGAAVWSLPAYSMQGVYAEIRNQFTRSSLNYIIISRMLEGKEQLRSASGEEQKDIVMRFRARSGELKGFYSLKSKERKSAQDLGVTGDPYRDEDEEASTGGQPPKTGFLNTYNLSFEERKRLHQQKEGWKQKQQPSPDVALPKYSTALENEEFEAAIRASVAQTSKGNPDEDAKVEQAIRASVLEMRRIAEQSRDFKQPVPDPRDTPHQSGTASRPPPPHLPPRTPSQSDLSTDHDLTNITDEEYQSLIEEAVRRSLAAHHETGHGENGEADEEQLARAIEESRLVHVRHDPPQIAIENDDAIRQALEESERAHREQQERERSQMTEEEIVLEYVKKQSLAEEEFRRKGKGVAAGRQGVQDDDDEDEEYKRAVEESLRSSGQSGQGSGSGGGM